MPAPVELVVAVMGPELLRKKTSTKRVREEYWPKSRPNWCRSGLCISERSNWLMA